MTHSVDIQSSNAKESKGFQEFTFIGDLSSKSTLESVKQLDPNSDCHFLHQIPTENSWLITKLYTSGKVTRQLRSLRLKPGKVVQLISKTNNGSVILSFDDKLIGIGSEIAQKIIVTFAS